MARRAEPWLLADGGSTGRLQACRFTCRCPSNLRNWLTVVPQQFFPDVYEAKHGPDAEANPDPYCTYNDQ